MITTIDYRVQFLVEKLLKSHVERVEANGGQVIVMDVHTGELMAMANYPFFNPNQYQSVPHAVLKIHALWMYLSRDLFLK